MKFQKKASPGGIRQLNIQQSEKLSKELEMKKKERMKDIGKI